MSAGTAHRRRDIQGLRAVAILLVVAFHAGLPLQGGFVGVDIFFVISGFVITTMLMRAHEATGGVDIPDFFIRRFRRLSPPLAVMVAATVLASALLLSPIDTHDLVISTAFGALLMFANIAIALTTGGYFDPAAETNPLLHTWTLSLEAQFYLVFVVLLVLGWRLSRRSTTAGAAVVLVASLTVASFTLAVLNEAGLGLQLLPDWSIGFYGLLGRSWEFGVGALLALGSLRLPAPSTRNGRAIGIAGLFLIALGVAVSTANTVYPGLATVAPVAGTALLLYAGSAADNPIARLLAIRPLVFLGNVSYSWYLWHWPLIFFARELWPGVSVAVVVAGAVSLIPAVISYRWVELPFTRGGARPPVRLRAAVLLLVASLALVTVLFAAVRADFWSPRVTALTASQQLHAANQAGCLSRVPLDDSTAADCTWNGDADGTPVYLIGDSVAEHYSEGLILAVEQLGMPLTITTAPGCPPYRMTSTATGADLTDGIGCGPYIDGTLDWLDDQAPGIVVLGASDVVEWMPGEEIPSGDSVESRRDEFRAALTGTIVRLEAHGHIVVIAKAPPSYRLPEPGWKPRDCTVAIIDAGQCSASLPLATVDEVQGMTRDVIDAVAEKQGATIVDPRSYFCSAGTCSTERAGVLLYHDDMHISVAASRLLEPLWIDALSSLR